MTSCLKMSLTWSVPWMVTRAARCSTRFLWQRFFQNMFIAMISESQRFSGSLMLEGTDAFDRRTYVSLFNVPVVTLVGFHRSFASATAMAMVLSTWQISVQWCEVKYPTRVRCDELNKTTWPGGQDNAPGLPPSLSLHL